MYIGTCVPWMAIETKYSKLCISRSLNVYLYAQLNKWALWLLFVMSKIKLSLVLNTRITLFDEKAIEPKFSKLCIFCSLDEHLYA